MLFAVVVAVWWSSRVVSSQGIIPPQPGATGAFDCGRYYLPLQLLKPEGAEVYELAMLNLETTGYERIRAFGPEVVSVNGAAMYYDDRTGSESGPKFTI